jgi:hypothetical protein
VGKAMDMQGGGILKCRPGEISSDSQMGLLCIVETLLNSQAGEMDLDEGLEKYKEWRK